jgi:catechol 2,3-dioxygenase-like lactoylglutathione lyase family enzyme
VNKHLTRLSHVGIPTSDLERSLDWYTRVLGLDEAFTLERDGKPWIIYLHLGPETFVELFAPRADQPKPPHTHFSIEVEDVDAATADLKTRIAQEQLPTDEIITGSDGSRILNFFDPDGHRVEFQELCPGSSQAEARTRLRAAKE